MRVKMCLGCRVVIVVVVVVVAVREPPVDLHGKFHVLLSDMAPSTTGDKQLNADYSFELCRQV